MESGLIIEAIEAESVFITHTPQPGGSYDAGGVWVPSAPDPRQIEAAVQPATGRDLQDLAEGLRENVRFKIYTTAAVASGDHVTIEGVTYRIMAVSQWPEYARANLAAKGRILPGHRLQGGVTPPDPFAALMSTLGEDAAQLIAHPLEYGSMFQDREGATPVTEPGQLVGLALDHGLTGSAPVPGPELVTNGGFDDATGWLLASGWTISGGVASYDGTDAPNAISQSATILATGVSYRVTITVTLSQGALLVRPNVGATAGQFQINASGTYNLVLRGGDGPIGCIAGNSGGRFIGSVSAISVRELPGYHATAISNAARGIFRDEGGFRWIEYNGVNTAYQTPVLPAPGVDKAQVFAAVRKLSDAARGVAIELSPSIADNNGAFGIFSPNSAGPDFAFESKGTTLQAAIASGIASPASRVLSGPGDISGDLATLRVNGTQVAQNTGDQGAGNYNPDGTYALHYGSRTGTALFFEGNHYATLGPIVRFSAANASAAQIEAAEAYYTARTDL